VRKLIGEPELVTLISDEEQEDQTFDIPLAPQFGKLVFNFLVVAILRVAVAVASRKLRSSIQDFANPKR